MKRVAIMTVDDVVWNLPLWDRTVPALVSAGYDVEGLWTCDDRLAGRVDADIYRWYQMAFGHFDFFLLTLFSVFVRLIRLLALRPSAFSGLTRRHGVFHAHVQTPNDAEFVQWLGANNIDHLLITVPHILGKEVLEGAQKSVINQHESLLPAHRGLSPYIWARLSGDDQGVTFHEVTEEIDAGKILYQEKMEDPGSLVAFHADVTAGYARRIVRALCGEEGFPVEARSSSYHGLPTEADCARFRAVGGKFIRFSDFFKISKLL